MAEDQSLTLWWDFYIQAKFHFFPLWKRVGEIWLLPSNYLAWLPRHCFSQEKNWKEEKALSLGFYWVSTDMAIFIWKCTDPKWRWITHTDTCKLSTARSTLKSFSTNRFHWYIKSVIKSNLSCLVVKWTLTKCCFSSLQNNGEESLTTVPAIALKQCLGKPAMFVGFCWLYCIDLYLTE